MCLQTQKEKRVTNMSPQQQIFICTFGDKINSEHSTSQINSSRIKINKQDNNFLYHTFVTSGSWDLFSVEKQKNGVWFKGWGRGVPQCLDFLQHFSTGNNCKQNKMEEEEEDEPQMTLLSCSCTKKNYISCLHQCLVRFKQFRKHLA